jgi:anti-sigma factor RsiW
MTQHLDLELSAYLDGDLDQAARAAVEQHLAECAACRETLEGLRRVVRRAGSLDDRPPTADLWAGIAERIGEPSVADVVPLASRRRRFAFSVPQLAAAAVALMLVSSGVTAALLLRPPDAQVASDTATVVQAVAYPGEDAVRSYDAAIADLQALLAARRAHLDTATARVVEQSLAVIDEAIRQARAALAKDPDNLYLNDHLQRSLDRKLELLRRVALAPVAS